MSKMVNQEKTVEELLEEVLVLKNEQPYEIPNNWEWVKFGKFLSITSGDSLTKKQMDEEGKIPVYGGNGVTGFHSKSNVDVPTIVIGRVGFYCGSVHETPKRAWVTENAFIVNYNKKLFNKRFLFWLLSFSDLKRYSNSSAQPVISGRTLNPSPLAFPPINEQKRIADKVERLLNKIDEAKQLIEEAKETFELRRLAILNKAFSGELLRKKVEYVELGNVVTIRSGKSISEDKLAENGEVPYFKVADMNTPENQQKMVFTSKFINSVDVKSNQIFPKGTVIFPKRGGAIKTNKKRIIIEDSMCDLNIMGLICSENIKPYYLYYWLLSIDLGQLDNGSSVPQINNKDIQPLLFPLMKMNDQEEMIKKIKVILEKEEEVFQIVMDKIRDLDYLKQSILSKAFSGELGTNDPTEVNAVELLKEVLLGQGK